MQGGEFCSWLPQGHQVHWNAVDRVNLTRRASMEKGEQRQCQRVFLSSVDRRNNFCDYLKTVRATLDVRSMLFFLLSSRPCNLRSRLQRTSPRLCSRASSLSVSFCMMAASTCSASHAPSFLHRGKMNPPRRAIGSVVCFQVTTGSGTPSRSVHHCRVGDRVGSDYSYRHFFLDGLVDRHKTDESES